MSERSTEVNTGKLSQVAANLSDLISRYNASVERLYDSGTQIEAMWDGEASRQFMYTLTNNRERFVALTRILERYVEVLNRDVSIYTRAEADVLSALSSNGIRE